MKHLYEVVNVCTGFDLRPGEREEAGKLVRLGPETAVAAPTVMGGSEGIEEVRMWLLKSCPHCQQGDLVVEEMGEDGVVADCLQCGYTADEQTVQWWLSLPQMTDAEVAEDNRAA